jgi:hypothetical protein
LPVRKQNGEVSTSAAGGSDCCLSRNKHIGHNSTNAVRETPSSAEPAITQSVLLVQIHVTFYRDCSIV